jgi:hypothetical protein
MTALSCPTLGPVIVVGEPEISVKPAEIGSDEYLYSCSHATLTNGFKITFPTGRLSAARNPTSVISESCESEPTVNRVLQRCERTNPQMSQVEIITARKIGA